MASPTASAASSPGTSAERRKKEKSAKEVQN
jgi:hypothetical protein